VKARLGGTEHDIAASCGARRMALRVDGREEECEFSRLDETSHEVTVGGRTHRAVTSVNGSVIWVRLNGRSWEVELLLDEDAEVAEGGADLLRSPMPGTVLSIAVEVGATVERGEIVLVVESMKMHTEIVAERDGVVEAVHVSAGETIQRDAPLVVFESEEEEE
jgi:biotin carboxyl carrier protein